MRPSLSTVLIAFGLISVFTLRISQSHATERNADSADAGFDSYKLKLPDAGPYRLKTSPEYQLQGRWGAPAPLPPAVPPAATNVPPTGLPYHDNVLAAAEKSGLEAALIHAVIRVESAYNPTVVSAKGAVGLMQLMPETAKRYGVKNSRDPDENIRGGTQYLIDLKRMFDGDLSLMLAAYNAGENAVIRSGHTVPRYAETIRYIPRVLAEYERLQRLIP